MTDLPAWETLSAGGGGALFVIAAYRIFQRIMDSRDTRRGRNADADKKEVDVVESYQRIAVTQAQAHAEQMRETQALHARQMAEMRDEHARQLAAINERLNVRDQIDYELLSTLETVVAPLLPKDGDELGQLHAVMAKLRQTMRTGQ